MGNTLDAEQFSLFDGINQEEEISHVYQKKLSDLEARSKLDEAFQSLNSQMTNDKADIDRKYEEMSTKKLNNSGWTGNKYLGTDSTGNIVVKNAPEQTTVTGTGLTTEQINAIYNLFKIASYSEDSASALDNFKQVFGISDSDDGDENLPVDTILGNISTNKDITLSGVTAGNYTLAYCDSEGSKLESWADIGIVEVIK